MSDINLIQAVEKFAAITHQLPDEDLELEWSWRAYHEGVRFAFFRTYEELRELAAALITERTTRGKPITTAQHALAQYHAAYRDLQAVLIGLEGSIIDAVPAKGEWPLRMILGHMIAAEREFFARIYHAVERFRLGNDELVEMSAQEVAEFVGPFEEFERTMNRLSIPGIMAYYDNLHKRVLRELTGIRGLELEAPSLWWEELPITVEFRLHRLDSHLRQHTIQIEKSLDALGRTPTEAKRLLRLIYAALSDVDATMIGAWGFGKEKRLEVAAQISQRADEIHQIVAGEPPGDQEDELDWGSEDTGIRT
jgi:hypothetical protein